MTKRHRTQALLVATAVFALVLFGALAWAWWASWNSARLELRTVAGALDQRSLQVRAEGIKLSALLPEGEDCDRGQLRKLIERSHYVRDIGRIRNNRIWCNALDGAGASIELGPPTLMRDTDNLRMWISPRGIYAAVGFSFLRMDPMTFVDMPLPPDTVGAVLDAETGRLLVHSDPVPKSLLVAAARLRSGELRQDGWLAEVSGSEDSRTIDIAARPEWAIQAAFVASLPARLSMGVLLGLFVSALVMAGFLRHYSLMSELKRALRMRRLDIALQPIVDASVSPARVVGFECLVRWTREDGQVVPPAVFVPMIEAAGLGSELARCVLSELLSRFGETLRAHRELYVSFNLTTLDIADSRLLDDIDRMLIMAHLRPSQVVIELTESSTAEVIGLAEGLERLRRAGHRLSIDDFGTGTSNASRLATFNPEIVKVDRSFLLHADSASHAAELLPQLVAMARSCGAHVVVEGVETPEQAALLAEYGDVLGQGYYWHRPMSAEAAGRLLRMPAGTASPAEEDSTESAVFDIAMQRR